MSTKKASIRDQAVALRQQIDSVIPAQTLAVFDSEAARFAAEGVPSSIARPGFRIPETRLLDAHGSETTLRAAQGGKSSVVVFYRGAWCPYCNIALRAYQSELLPGLVERGVALIALSPQKPDESLSAQEKNELTFTVLSDPGNRLAGALGVVTRHSDEARAAQAGRGVDVAATNADGSHNIPMPTTLVVDADGVLRWIDVHPDYTSHSEVADILAAVDTWL